MGDFPEIAGVYCELQADFLQELPAAGGGGGEYYFTAGG
jgi:hypothetical protein